MATRSGSGHRSARRAARGLAAALAVGALVAGLAGGCGSTASTPSGDATASLEISASIVTDGPTAEPTTTPVPTPRPLPNLTGEAPDLDPDPPTCNVDFVLDFVVTNTGAGATLSEAIVFAAATRNSDGRIDLKTPMPNLPILAAGASVHLTKTVTITRGGPHTMTMFIDSSLWIAETNEADNQITRAVNVLYGTCSKV